MMRMRRSKILMILNNKSSVINYSDGWNSRGMIKGFMSHIAEKGMISECGDYRKSFLRGKAIIIIEWLGGLNIADLNAP
jgi:hypothetical protein